MSSLDGGYFGGFLNIELPLVSKTASSLFVFSRTKSGIRLDSVLCSESGLRFWLCLVPQFLDLFGVSEVAGPMNV